MENTGKVLNNPIGFVADEVLGSLSFIVKSGIIKIVQGIGNVAAGLIFIIAPIPTYADDYYGAKMVAKGVYQIARGFRKFAAILEE